MQFWSIAVQWQFVEAIVNSRPLSHILTEDVEEPVTPSHLICGGQLLSLPYRPHYEDLEEDFLEHSVLKVLTLLFWCLHTMSSTSKFLEWLIAH